MNINFVSVLRRGLRPCLHSRGFTHKGMDHWRDLANGVSHEVLVYRPSNSQPPDGTDFYLDCSVNAHAFFELYPERRGRLKPHESPSQIFVRPGELCGYKYRDPWFLPAGITDEGLATISYELRELFEQYVLPWFDQLDSPKAVGDYLASPEKGPGRHPRTYREIPQWPVDLRNAAIAYFGAREYDRAREMLDLATKTIDREGRHATADLRERIERLIAQRQAAHAGP